MDFWKYAAQLYRYRRIMYPGRTPPQTFATGGVDILMFDNRDA